MHSHMAAATVDMIWKPKVKHLPPPAYNPDLAPSDYYIFRLFKDVLYGCWFADGAYVVSHATEKHPSQMGSKSSRT